MAFWEERMLKLISGECVMPICSTGHRSTGRAHPSGGAARKSARYDDLAGTTGWNSRRNRQLQNALVLNGSTGRMWLARVFTPTVKGACSEEPKRLVLPQINCRIHLHTKGGSVGVLVLKTPVKAGCLAAG